MRGVEFQVCIRKKCENESEEKYSARKDFCFLWDSHGNIVVSW